LDLLSKHLASGLFKNNALLLQAGIIGDHSLEQSQQAIQKQLKLTSASKK